MGIAALVALAAALALALMTALWLVQRRTGNAGIVDAGWALGIGAVAVAAGLLAEGSWAHRACAALVGGGWGLRLGAYLLRDRVVGRPEDGRYQAMRAWMGARAQAGFLLFFWVQAGLIVLFALPMILVAADARPAGWHLLPAALLWAASIAGAWSADRQLERFRADPASRGRTCRSGWWARCRHPNYFFEWLQWWGWMAAGVGAAHGHGWWLLAWPALMWLFLRHLTGVPFVERRALLHRPDYAAYRREVPMLIPRLGRVTPP